MRWTPWRARRDALKRTAKSCGSDAPTLASSWSMMPAHHASDDASHHTGDGGNKARSPGRARRKPLKPLCRECRREAAHLWRLLVCFLLCTRGYGCGAHPAFPAPSLEGRAAPSVERDNVDASPGRVCAAGMRGRGPSFETRPVAAPQDEVRTSGEELRPSW
jgi:hypothetical protein